jgi:hypothetical protein
VELALGRIGHYCSPRMGDAFSCQAAFVTHIGITNSDGSTKVNLRVYDADADPFVRLDVTALVLPDPEHATFHLNMNCPFGR